MKALFSAVMTGGVFVLAVTAMTGCASAEQQRRWQIEALGGQTTPADRAAARRRAWEARQEERRRREIRRARIIRTAPVVTENKCQPTLAAVGDQYASEQGAQQEADKAWMQTARWQYGERYMSRDNADDAAYECGRSSVGSVVGQVFYRCRLTAKPCRPEKSQGR
jgi:ribonuclease D